jgi:hypothetical protein
LPVPPEDVLWIRCTPEQGDNYWSPRVIRKRTERFVYVDPSAGNLGEKTVKLDLAELEANGCVWSRPCREEFYTAAGKERREAQERIAEERVRRMAAAEEDGPDE